MTRFVTPPHLLQHAILTSLVVAPMTDNNHRSKLEAELKSKFEENLLSLTTSEVQIRHKLHRLEKVLDLYQGYWSEWKGSTGCFLNEREVMSIDYYSEYQTHSVLARELEISPSRVSAIYNKALRRLENNHHLYRHWIANKIFTKAGLHTVLDAQDQFLMRPMHEHQMSQKLFMLLSLEAENLSELLTRYSEKQLARIRGFGKKRMVELKALLEENGCLHRLRPSDDPEDIIVDDEEQ